MPCHLGPGAISVASQRRGRAARFKKERVLPKYQKIFGHGMVLTLRRRRRCCCCCCCFFFFYFLFFLTHNYHAYIYFLFVMVLILFL